MLRGLEEPRPVRTPPGEVARVSVLGRPLIDNMATAGQQTPSVRRAAMELMVYLALHPEGATASQITSDVFCTTSRRPAPGRRDAALAALRLLLSGASGGSPDRYVVERRHRYHLAVADAADVDVWRVHEHLFRAACAFDAPTKIAELRLACAGYRGPLAEGTAYPWIAPHRERVHGLITEATATLAGLVDRH